MIEQNKGISSGFADLDKLTYGSSIRDMEDEIIEDILRKKELNKQGIIGIPSGFEELDKIIHGWLPGNELVTIVSANKDNNSWLLQKFLTEANKQGKKVLLYTREKALLSAYRNDILSGNFNNINEPDLPEYTVIASKDLQGRHLTVSELRHYIQVHKPDIVGIHDLSIMRDEEEGNNAQEQYNNISNNLLGLSGLLEIPILVTMQDNIGDDKLEHIELDDLGISYEPTGYSSRVITIATNDKEAKMKLIKNRFGPTKWEYNISLNESNEILDLINKFNAMKNK